MRLLLSNNKQVENNVNKDRMETQGNQQSAISCTDQRQASPEARLHRLTVCKDCHAAKEGP
jgi:hypothetical protein